MPSTTYGLGKGWPVLLGDPVPATRPKKDNTMTVEIKLRRKYREPKSMAGHKAKNYAGNNGTSAGKHTAHPDVIGFRKKGYKVEAKWNPKAN